MFRRIRLPPLREIELPEIAIGIDAQVVLLAHLRKRRAVGNADARLIVAASGIVEPVADFGVDRTVGRLRYGKFLHRPCEQQRTRTAPCTVLATKSEYWGRQRVRRHRLLEGSLLRHGHSDCQQLIGQHQHIAVACGRDRGCRRRCLTIGATV